MFIERHLIKAQDLLAMATMIKTVSRHLKTMWSRIPYLNVAYPSDIIIIITKCHIKQKLKHISGRLFMQSVSDENKTLTILCLLQLLKMVTTEIFMLQYSE